MGPDDDQEREEPSTVTLGSESSAP
jgi:hypothetical protein